MLIKLTDYANDPVCIDAETIIMIEQDGADKSIRYITVAFANYATKVTVLDTMDEILALINGEKPAEVGFTPTRTKKEKSYVVKATANCINDVKTIVTQLIEASIIENSSSAFNEAVRDISACVLDIHGDGNHPDKEVVVYTTTSSKKANMLATKLTKAHVQGVTVIVK